MPYHLMLTLLVVLFSATTYSYPPDHKDEDTRPKRLTRTTSYLKDYEALFTVRVGCIQNVAESLAIQEGAKIQTSAQLRALRDLPTPIVNRADYDLSGNDTEIKTAFKRPRPLSSHTSPEVSIADKESENKSRKINKNNHHPTPIEPDSENRFLKPFQQPTITTTSSQRRKKSIPKKLVSADDTSDSETEASGIQDILCRTTPLRINPNFNQKSQAKTMVVHRTTRKANSNNNNNNKYICPFAGCLDKHREQTILTSAANWLDHFKTKHTETLFFGKKLNMHETGEHVLASQDNLCCLIEGCNAGSFKSFSALGRHLKETHSHTLDIQPFNIIWRNKLNSIMNFLALSKSSDMKYICSKDNCNTVLSYHSHQQFYSNSRGVD